MDLVKCLGAICLLSHRTPINMPATVILKQAQMASCPHRGRRFKLWNKKTWRSYLSRGWVNWQHSVGSELWTTLCSSHRTCKFEQCVSTLEHFHSRISEQWKGHQFYIGPHCIFLRHPTHNLRWALWNYKCENLERTMDAEELNLEFSANNSVEKVEMCIKLISAFIIQY